MASRGKKAFTLETQGALSSPFGTTLYEMVEAVCEEVSPDEDGLVPVVVGLMIHDCTARFSGEHLRGCIKIGSPYKQYREH